VRRRLRALLPRLHVLPTLTERPGDTVVSIGADDSISELADRVAPDGDVLVVDESVDALEHVRRKSTAPNIFYLLGSLDVLPLMDASVDELVATSILGPDATIECFRVLRPGGMVALTTRDEDPTGHALNLNPSEIERLFIAAGFDAVSVAAARNRLVVAARKP